jgi:hypothetical protein
MTTLCIKDQYGVHDRYRRRMDIQFGLLLAQYLRSKGIPPRGPRGGIFLSRGERIGLDKRPSSRGFGVGYHVITFVNLLTFFSLNDLVYQSQYALTIVNGSRGVPFITTQERDGVITFVRR